MNNVTAPPSVRGEHSAVVQTLDASGGIIDGAAGLSHLRTCAVTVGQIGGLSVVLSHYTPGVSTTGTLQFVASGGLPKGGLIELSFPASWTLSTNVTVAYATSPSGPFSALTTQANTTGSSDERLEGGCVQLISNNEMAQ